MATDRTRLVVRRIRRALIVTGLGLIAVTAAYTRLAFEPAGFGPEVLASDARVRVEARADALVFEPTVDRGDAGLIFYPGCPVPSEAYAPLGRAIAAHGYPAFVMRVPYRCATVADQQQQLFAATRAIIAASRRRWILAGHSYGGLHASELLSKEPRLVDGLVLIGTTHPRAVDLSSLTIPVTKVYGTHDRVAPEDKVRANVRLLPPSARWVRIEGGNHRQFGWYRYQLWDGAATISRELQQQQTLAAILDLLARPEP